MDKSENKYPQTVSICMIALNEEKYLPNALHDLYNQTYPRSKTEFILVDGGSTDKTKKIMEEFAEVHKDEYIKITVLDNVRRIQSAGWNIALVNAQCDVVVRIDAHTAIPPEFVELNMINLQKGELVSGGVRPCLIMNDTLWDKALLSAENSLFGSSISHARSGVKEENVSTLFHGAYCRKIFADVGGFNENLLRTEDNELHYRIRHAGYNLHFDPHIISYQYARSNLRKMMKQKYGNGYWIGLTLGICPGCVYLYHLIPFAFVMGIAFTTILAIIGMWWFAAAMWFLYLSFCIISVFLAFGHEKPNPFFLLLPFMFLMLHVSYGIGTLVGLIKMPFKRKKLKDCEMVDVVKEKVRKDFSNENNLYKPTV